MRVRTVRQATAVLAVMLLAGCAESGPPDPTSPPGTPSESRTYDEEELALYREAVRLVEEFEDRNQPILAVGKATRQAKELYRDSLREWQASYAKLQSFERDGVRIAHGPVVLSTRATSIKSFQDDAAEVVLARCTDQSELGMTRNGELLPPAHAEPVIQEVVVHRYENRTWRIGEFTTTDQPCAG